MNAAFDTIDTLVHLLEYYYDNSEKLHRNGRLKLEWNNKVCRILSAVVVYGASVLWQNGWS